MAKWEFTAPDGKLYEVEGPDNEDDAWAAVQEQIKRDVQQEYADLPVWQEPLQSLDDAARSFAGAATIGGADWLASQLSGRSIEAERYETAKAKQRLGITDIPVSMLGYGALGRLVPSAVGPAVKTIGGPSGVRALVSGGTAAAETGALSGLEAGIKDEDVGSAIETGAVFGPLGRTIAKGVETLAPLAKRGGNYLGGLLSKPGTITKVPPAVQKPAVAAEPIAPAIVEPQAPKVEAEATPPLSVIAKEATEVPVTKVPTGKKAGPTKSIADRVAAAEKAASKADVMMDAADAAADAVRKAPMSKQLSLRVKADAAAEAAKKATQMAARLRKEADDAVAETTGTVAAAQKVAPKSTPSQMPRGPLSTEFGANIQGGNVAPVKPPKAAKGQKAAAPVVNVRDEAVTEVMDAIDRAKTRAKGSKTKGFDNALSGELERVLNNKKITSTLTPDELALIRKAHGGDVATKISRSLSHLASWQSVMSSGPGGAALAFGVHPALGLLVPGIPALGHLARYVKNSGAREKARGIIDTITGKPKPPPNIDPKLKEDIYKMFRMLGR